MNDSCTRQTELCTLSYLLLREAAKNALSRDAECIKLVDLARAYERISHINDGKDLNPFAMRDVHLLRQHAE